MPIYGEQLAFFPELLMRYEIFSLPPKIGGGYGERMNVRTVIGYFSRRKDSAIGIEGDNRTDNWTATFWALDNQKEQGRIQKGEYIEEGGELFIFKSGSAFVREGGFLVYELQLVAAVTDNQVERRISLTEDLRGLL